MRNGDFLLHFKEQELILTPEKALYWSNKEALVLSDVHFGKSGHFRKAGIPIPNSINQNNFERLDTLIKHFNPKNILFLGDLFHSDRNSEWEEFQNWRKNKKEIGMYLAIGNHDFHSLEEYESIGLLCSRSIELLPFILLHNSEEIKADEKLYSISGHIHPSVKLTGKGRQSIKIPCFYFGNTFAILPAFGSFTGTHSIKPKTKELVFGVLNNQIIEILS
ncbi:MAG: ligase-associated DNA damage response endonuclease PdeM [Balneolaceae bacterium]